MTGADKHNMASGSGVLRGHKRLRLVMAGFTLGFGVLIGKAGWLTLVEGANQDKTAHHDVKVRIPRPDISDRQWPDAGDGHSGFIAVCRPCQDDRRRRGG
jgi:hypothetical protein